MRLRAARTSAVPLTDGNGLRQRRYPWCGGLGLPHMLHQTGGGQARLTETSAGRQGTVLQMESTDSRPPGCRALITLRFGAPAGARR